MLYPLALHCYLELVANGSSSHAATLIARAQRRFLVPSPPADGGGSDAGDDALPPGGSLRAQELADLQSASVPQHLATNRTAAAARRARYPVAMSRASFGLLMSFLQQERLYLLLHLANQRLRFSLSEGAPAGAAAVDDGNLLASAGLQAAAGDAAAVNARPLRLGLLAGGLEEVLQEERSRAVQAVPEVDEEVRVPRALLAPLLALFAGVREWGSSCTRTLVPSPPHRGPTTARGAQMPFAPSALHAWKPAPRAAS